MKKMFFGILLLGVATLANAQTFKPFKFDFATGYAIPGGSGSKGGVLFALEPKYAVNDAITVGLRCEGAIMARAVKDGTGEYVAGDVKASGSYALTGDYYFNTNSFRPFAGIGVGLFSSAAASVNSSGDYVEGASGRKLGGFPRVGFEFGHFRAAIEYNLAGKTGSINNNYFGIKLGFFAGGGRID